MNGRETKLVYFFWEQIFYQEIKKMKKKRKANVGEGHIMKGVN